MSAETHHEGMLRLLAAGPSGTLNAPRGATMES